MENMKDLTGETAKLHKRKRKIDEIAEIDRYKFDSLGQPLPRWKWKLKNKKRTLRMFTGGTLVERKYGCYVCQKEFTPHQTVLTYPTGGRKRSCPDCGSRVIKDHKNMQKTKPGTQ